MPALLPTGRQIELAAHGQTAVVVEVGGGLREYGVGGRPVVDGYEADAMPTGARGLPLVPWPNRVRDGRYSFGGTDHALPVNERATGNASHGLARELSWVPVAVEDDRVTMAVTLWPRAAWPFTLTVTVEYALTAAGLAVTTTAENSGTGAAPWASAHHPYLTVGTDTVDGIEVLLPADTYLPVDEQLIPTGREQVAGTPYDVRGPRLVGDAVIDHAYTDVARGPDGLVRVTLRNPQDGREAELWADAAYDFVQLFTGDTLPEAQRRRGLAIEPMTAPANALQTGESLVVLEPGQVHTGRWGIIPRGW